MNLIKTIMTEAARNADYNWCGIIKGEVYNKKDYVQFLDRIKTADREIN